MLTSLATVKSLLGITVSTYDTALTMLIAGVDEQVKRYCARQFEVTDVIYKNSLDHGREIVLDETPVNSILYFGTGAQEVIKLVCSAANAQASFRVTAGAGVLTLVAGMVTTAIPVPIGTTLAQLEVLIDAELNWSATVTTGYEDYPANCLLDQSAETEEASYSFYLRGALSTRRLIRHEAEGIYEISGDSCDEQFLTGNYDRMVPVLFTTPFVCIYNGGYTTVPAGLTLIVNQCCCDAWRNFSNNAAMKSETVGDYQYTKFDAAQIASAIGPYMSALDLYKRV